MATMANWNGHTFVVSPALIRSFTELTIKGGCETTEKNSDKQKYVERKYGEIPQITTTVPLSALTGVTDVRAEAMAFIEEATAGASGYFYLGTEKLLNAPMMLTEAEVLETVSMPGDGGTWIECRVKLTFRQGAKTDGTGSASSKASVKATSVKSTAASGSAQGAVGEAAKLAMNLITTGLNSVKTLCDAAKAASARPTSGLTRANAITNADTTTKKDTAKKTSATTGRASGTTASKITTGAKKAISANAMK